MNVNTFLLQFIFPISQNLLMSIYLVDTSTKRDIYINDALANQGLALFESDTPQDEMGLEVYELESNWSEVSMCVHAGVPGH